MIIKGKSRSGPAALAIHLANAEMNETVKLVEVRGTVATDLRGALIEMDALAIGTRCEKPLYHAAISPEPPHRLTLEQRAEAIDALEKTLGLDGHARLVVMHEKQGREHVHVVWSRINLAQMRSVSDSHNYRKHEEVARDLERRFGHDRVQGAHHERDGVERPDRTPSRAELRQEERSGIRGKGVKAEVTEAFQSADNAHAFKSALEDRGYLLAQGDRRDFVVIDRFGGVHSLARRIDGVRAPDLREFMLGIDRDALPSVERAKEMVAERSADRAENRIEAAYGTGDDYVHQATAAQRDFKLRQKRLNEEWSRSQQPGGDPIERPASPIASPPSPSDGRHLDENEIARRVSRFLDDFDDRSSSRGLADDERPDRQREAPGGGRTRSR